MVVLGPAGFECLRNFCASQDISLKLLYAMRDPVERMWSQLRHMTQTNPDSDFVSNWAEAFRSPRVCARADYRGTINDLDDTFPADDILYLFYEDLFTEAALTRLCGHIGTAYGPADAATVRNETTVRTEMPEDARAAAHVLLAPQYAFCRDRFGAAIPKAWAG